jgi:hypothetical protein
LGKIPHALEETFDMMLSCVARIEESVARLEKESENGGLPETVNDAEVKKWQEKARASNGSSGKSEAA